MLKIAVGILSYNCRDELERCLSSLKDFSPIFVVDGKWNDFKDGLESYSSTDGTLDLKDKYPNIYYILSPNQPEYVNRDKYLIEAGLHGCDALLVIDSDDYFTGNYREFVKSIEKLKKEQPDKLSFKITVNSIRSGGDHWPPNLILNPAKCHYKDRHNQVWCDGKEVFGGNTGSIISGIRVFEDKSFRTDKRENDMRCRNIENPTH